MMWLWAAAAMGSATSGGIVVRLDYESHLFLPTDAARAAARGDRSLRQWLDAGEATWRLVPAALTTAERVERLVGTGCGSAVVAGAPAASLADVQQGGHSDGEAWWVLPTGEPLTEQVRGQSSVDPVPACGLPRTWLITHTAHRPGTRHYGVLLVRRTVLVDAAVAHLSDADDAAMVRWARSLERGVYLWNGPMSHSDAVWHDALMRGDAYAVLPTGIVTADTLQALPHPYNGTEEWWSHAETGAIVWPVPASREPVTAEVEE